MGSIVVVVVLPLLESFGEQPGVVQDLAFEELVELVRVDPMGSFDAPMLSRPVCGLG